MTQHLVDPDTELDVLNSKHVELYSQHVNPTWVKLLDVLGLNVRYKRAVGAELHTEDGRIVLDCLSGYCVHNAGHNHPHIIAELISQLERQTPSMLQSNVVESAGQLASLLCARAGGKIAKAFFCSSGSEGVEAVIKFSRAHTGRNDIVYAAGAFHGLTCGALSLMGSDFWREGFGPMLAGTHEVPFGNLAKLEQVLKECKVAAVVLEPIQAEAGIILPAKDYLAEVQKLCHKYDALLVLDEVQTGMGRTGRFLAAERYEVTPDMVVLAKALSGGLVPVGAVLMSEAIYQSVFHSLGRAFIHTSTFSESSLAMRAGLATMEVLDREGLAERADKLGIALRDRLRIALTPFEMIKDVRGEGLLTGIEFQAPRSLSMRLSFQAFQAIHPALFGQILVMRLFKDKNILTQICGNNFMVLKVAPPLVVSEQQLDECVAAIRDVLEMMHSSAAFWSDALKLGRRAASSS